MTRLNKIMLAIFGCAAIMVGTVCAADLVNSASEIATDIPRYKFYDEVLSELNNLVDDSDAMLTRVNQVADGTGIAGTQCTLTGPLVSTSGGGVLDAGSYGSKLTQTGTEMATIATTKATGYAIGYGAYINVTGEDGYPFGFAALVESLDTTGTKTLQGAQLMAFLGTPGGSQAATLKTRGGDATAGMYGLWLKTGANNNCVFASGSRSAPLWVDNQCGGTHNGEEYGIFSSTGMSRPDAWAGFETTSSGYDQLLYFDETFNSGAGVCVTTDAVPGTQDARIKVYYNGTQYYIPLYR